MHAPRSLPPVSRRASRGQVSAEFFLVFVLFSLAFLWFANYVNEANAASSSRTLLFQRGVARSLAAHAGFACVSQANVTAELPCLAQGNATYAYRADYAGTTVTVQSDQTGFSASAATACNATGTLFASACSGASSQSGCFVWSNNTLNVSTGACTS